MSCGEYYPENSAYFTTEKAIRKMDRTGGVIKALPYDSLFGRVNISANTPNAGFIFEPINKRSVWTQNCYRCKSTVKT
jgi:hypothetical protein